MKQRYASRFVTDSQPETPSWESVSYWFTVFGPAKRAQLENYWELTREFKETQETAAARMGVSIRTIGRYEADIKAAMEEIS